MNNYIKTQWKALKVQDLQDFLRGCQRLQKKELALGFEFDYVDKYGKRVSYSPKGEPRKSDSEMCMCSIGVIKAHRMTKKGTEYATPEPVTPEKIFCLTLSPEGNEARVEMNSKYGSSASNIISINDSTLEKATFPANARPNRERRFKRMVNRARKELKSRGVKPIW